jgi:hypothetical protein
MANDSPISRLDRNPEAKFEDVAALSARDVRVRVEFRLYNPTTQRYVGWPNANWTLDVRPDAEVAKQLLEAFEAFADALATIGPAAAIVALAQAEDPHPNE